MHVHDQTLLSPTAPSALASAPLYLPLSPRSLCLLLLVLLLPLSSIYIQLPKMPVLGKDDQQSNMHAILVFIIPALLNFISMKYQARHNSPFETNPITVFFSIFALLLYCSLCLPYVARLPALNTTVGARVFRLLTIFSFSLSIALPTWLLFPGLSFFLLFLPLIILLSAAHLCSLVQKLIRLVKQKILALAFVHLIRRRLVRGRAAPLLPRVVADTHFVVELLYVPEFHHLR